MFGIESIIILFDMWILYHLENDEFYIILYYRLRCKTPKGDFQRQNQQVFLWKAAKRKVCYIQTDCGMYAWLITASYPGNSWLMKEILTERVTAFLYVNLLAHG